jgi:RNA polymerase sigma factor (sigma-70 family)
MSDASLDKDLWRYLSGKIARRVSKPLDAEDLLHSAYLRMVRYRAEHVVANPAAFLVRAACNISIDNYRRDKVIADESEAFEVRDLTPLQDEVIAARDRLNRVKSGLERLSPKTRDIFLMHRLQNMKYQEIANAYGISQSAVEKHIAKALSFLQNWADGW